MNTVDHKVTEVAKWTSILSIVSTKGTWQPPFLQIGSSLFELLHNFFYVSLTPPPPPHIHSICFRRTCYWYLLHFKGKLQNHISVKSKLNVRGVGRGDCGREKNIQTWKKLAKLKKKRWKYVYCPTTKIQYGGGGGRNFIQYKIFLSYTTNYTSSTSLQRACWKRSGGLNLHPSVWYLNDVYFAKTLEGGGLSLP